MKHLLIFFISFFLCLALTFFLKNIGNTYEFFDIAPEDDPLKIHKKSISYLGGGAMMLTISCGLLLIALLKKDLAVQILAMAIGSLIIFALGFWDDLKWKNISQPKPIRKFICLIIFPLLSAFILFTVGLNVNFLNVAFLNYFLTFFTIFILVNSVNYEDGIDGLAGGLVLLSFIGFFILSLLLHNEITLIFSLIFSGAVAGFLFFNFPPAKIFMGDSGAFFLGYLVSIFTLFFSKPFNIFSLVGILFICGFPVFEGVFTNLRRITSKKSIFFGDREHLYDTLYLKRGFSIQKTLLICYIIQAIFVVIGLITYLYGNSTFKA